MVRQRRLSDSRARRYSTSAARLLEGSRNYAASSPLHQMAAYMLKRHHDMDYKKLSLGLGLFSLALGAAELLASPRIAETLDSTGHEGLIKGFGAREVAAGMGILTQPAASIGVWNRVVGDAMDLVALALAARSSPRNKAVWGSIAFVAGATALDAVVARGLDRQTGKTVPTRNADVAV